MTIRHAFDIGAVVEDQAEQGAQLRLEGDLLAGQACGLGGRGQFDMEASVEAAARGRVLRPRQILDGPGELSQVTGLGALRGE